MSDVYKLARDFKRRYPNTVAFRLKQHAKVIEQHLNPNEEIKYLFLGQKNSGTFDFVNTYIIAITNQRIMLATKRIVFGYFFKSITFDLYNDFTISCGLIWGRIIIDTVKEKVLLSNIDKNALPEIETNFTTLVSELKREYLDKDKE